MGGKRIKHPPNAGGVAQSLGRSQPDRQRLQLKERRGAGDSWVSIADHGLHPAQA
jgi:hypothetical protein